MLSLLLAAATLPGDTAPRAADTWREAIPGIDDPLSERAWRGLVSSAAMRDASALRVHDGPPEDPEEPPAPPRTIAELRERIQEVLDGYDVPGVGVALVEHDGSIWSGGVGVADRETPVQVAADTVFRAGSISKSFVALSLLTMVEDGRLRLDTPVRELVPELEMGNPWAEDAPITVAHALEHTAGFDDARFNEIVLAASERQTERSLAEALERNPRSRVSRWQPGSYFAYSNPGYSVAAAVIESLTAQPFDLVIERSVIAPLGMQDTSFAVTPEMRTRLAQGYGERNQPEPYRYLYHRAAGDLKASPRDLGRLVKMLIDRGKIPRPTPEGAADGPGAPDTDDELGRRLLRARSIARMERSGTRSQPLAEVGYGLGNHAWPAMPVAMRGHGGLLPGFLSDYSYSSELGVGFALLFNSSSAGAAAAHLAVRDLVTAYLIRDLKLDPPPWREVPREQLAAYVGYYELASPRHQLTGFLERALGDLELKLMDDRLHLRWGASPFVPLVPLGDGSFRFLSHAAGSVAFTVDEDGTRRAHLLDFTFEEGTGWYGNLRRKGLKGSFSLLQIGVFWNFVWLPGWLFVMSRARKRLPLPPGAPPALAALCFFAMLKCINWGLLTGDLGHVHASSVGYLLLSGLFPLLSVWAVIRVVAGLRQEPPISGDLEELASFAAFGIPIYSRGLRTRVYDVGIALACLGLSLYLGYHGVLALRTWAW
ncbi:serine hydrolase domain-containing protein [Haliangium ochraceum]|uniref:Beta-lactamase n=1 Tax=Haliangium ochraceum (strain DSM 14365 / JCM 11303 / SMP-2) TaxID=502025 RepID=D0LHA3_HALO1|nr:serine hydrolase domain-containing protein [Haliangium ochraceum]ACY18248.1 beta-lactamase [Haliangium ochraceum DSM 14365]